MVTREGLDRPDNEPVEDLSPAPRPAGIDADLVDAEVAKDHREQRQQWKDDGERTLDEASQAMRRELAFSSREGLLEAQFEKSVDDEFHRSADEAARAEHDREVAHDRLADAIDEALDTHMEPGRNLDEETQIWIAEAERDVLDAEDRYDATRNNGLPLDPPLDIEESRELERERYILSTTHEVDGVEVSRDEYIIETTKPITRDPMDGRDHQRNRQR